MGENRKWTVAVDCDGVLHSYTTPWVSADHIPDPPVPGAIDWLNEICQKFDVAIHTTRGDQKGGNEAVMTWLRDNGFAGPDLLVTSRKIPALIYVDDRAYRFEGDNFPTANEVHQLRPWHKK